MYIVRRMHRVRNTEEESECLSNPAGRGYTGTVNVTASGISCAPWIDTANEFLYVLPDTSTRDAVNYCRYIPLQQWGGTSCAVHTKSGYHLKRCGVPYCGGTEAALLRAFDKKLCYCGGTARRACQSKSCQRVHVQIYETSSMKRCAVDD